MTSNTTNLWCWCDQPEEVWTGSTNLSLGGFSGQTNVGHCARPNVARQFVAYWELINTDPVRREGDDRSEAMLYRSCCTAGDPDQYRRDPIRDNLSLQSAPRQGRCWTCKLVDSAKTCLRWHSVSIIRSSRSCNTKIPTICVYARKAGSSKPTK